MKYSNHDITLDLHDVQSRVQISVKKGDTARTLRFSLMQNGKNYRLRDGCTATISILKPDGNVVFNACNINKDKILEYTFTPQTTNVVGLYNCEIRLYGTSNDLLQSPTFTMLVHENAIMDDVVVTSSSEFTALTEAMSQANRLNLEVSTLDDGRAEVTITKRDGSVKTIIVGGGEGSGSTEETDLMRFYKVNLEQIPVLHFVHYDEETGIGETLNYAQLAEKYRDSRYFLFCEYANVTFIPSLPPDDDVMHEEDVLEFSAVWNYGGEQHITALKINSNNVIKVDEFVCADASEVEDIIDRIAEAEKKIITLEGKTIPTVSISSLAYNLSALNKVYSAKNVTLNGTSTYMFDCETVNSIISDTIAATGTGTGTGSGEGTSAPSLTSHVKAEDIGFVAGQFSGYEITYSDVLDGEGGIDVTIADTPTTVGKDFGDGVKYDGYFDFGSLGLYDDVPQHRCFTYIAELPNVAGFHYVFPITLFCIGVKLPDGRILYRKIRLLSSPEIEVMYYGASTGYQITLSVKDRGYVTDRRWGFEYTKSSNELKVNIYDNAPRYLLNQRVAAIKEELLYLEQKVDSLDGTVTSAITVKSFGAVGDGVTDDTDAIRQARDYCNENHIPLHFPYGTYLVHGTIQLFSGMKVTADNGAVIKKIPCITRNLKASASAGATKVFVDDVSGFVVGHDVYIGVPSWGNYNDTVGVITSINTSEKSISFKNYHRHSKSDTSGLNREVTTSGVIAQTFPILSTLRYDDSGDNLIFDGLTLDGNVQPNEPNCYVLSPIHIDPYNNQGANVDGKGLLIRNCTIINCNADGFSMQNMGRTTVENCTVYGAKMEGIHPGFNCDGVNISNCYVYDCGESGIFDCNNVHGLNISNCYIHNCAMGIYGLEYTSKGTTINGCTFDACPVGIRCGANTYGSAICGCAFTDCTKGVFLYHNSGDTTVNGCTFGKCTEGITLQTANNTTIVGNYFVDCDKPIHSSGWTSDMTFKGANHIIANNIITSSLSGKTSKIYANWLKNTMIYGNVLSGNNASIDVGTTTENISKANNMIGGVADTDPIEPPIGEGDTPTQPITFSKSGSTLVISNTTVNSITKSGSTLVLS